MKEKISENFDNPEILEKMYRDDRHGFIRDFNEAAGENDSGLISFWKIRLRYETDASASASLPGELLFVAAIALISALLVKIPIFIPLISEESFLFRNIAIIIMTGLILYTARIKKITSTGEIAILALPVIILTLYLNLLPGIERDTVIIACIHVPVLLWFGYGLAYTSFDYRDPQKVTGFISRNGELVIMTGLILIAGAILSGMTIALFSALGIEIGDAYMKNLAFPGAVATPVISAWLISRYPELTGKIAPLIARIFTPLVLISSLIYLITMTVSGISLVQNRDFLILFNLLLLAVMAIIVFSVSESNKSHAGKIHLSFLLMLTIVTLLIDVMAIVAISSRLTGGITPNRAVVLLSNILIFVHLLLILPGLYSACFKNGTLSRVEKAITGYLPVYFIYALLAVFILPAIFGWR